MMTLIVNRVNGKNNFIKVPTDATNAQSFATTFLDGEFAVYKPEGAIGTSDIVTVAPDVVNVMFKNKSTDLKSYATLYVSPTKTDEQIFAALMGLTLNGVHIDEAYITKRTTATRF